MENEKAEKELEKAEEQNDEFRELTKEERYNKLMDLLNKSKFYSKFLHDKMTSEDEEAKKLKESKLSERKSLQIKNGKKVHYHFSCLRDLLCPFYLALEMGASYTREYHYVQMCSNIFLKNFHSNRRGSLTFPLESKGVSHSKRVSYTRENTASKKGVFYMLNFN